MINLPEIIRKEGSDYKFRPFVYPRALPCDQLIAKSAKNARDDKK
jgi:hypothetical protein